MTEPLPRIPGVQRSVQQDDQVGEERANAVQLAGQSIANRVDPMKPDGGEPSTPPVRPLL